MTNIGEKILKIVFGEIAGAFIFIVALMTLGTLPNDQISLQLTSTIFVLWGIYGIGTPIVIFAELEKEILKIFGGLKR